MEDINFIKDNSLTPDMLDQVLHNGYFLGKLINRLESRDDLIKGIDSKPKNNAKLKANWSKICDYLKKKPKFECDLI